MCWSILCTLSSRHELSDEDEVTPVSRPTKWGIDVVILYHMNGNAATYVRMRGETSLFKLGRAKTDKSTLLALASPRAVTARHG
jgi:hypothetical protein